MKPESRTSRGHLVAGLGTRWRRAFLLLLAGTGLVIRLGARTLRGGVEARELGRELRQLSRHVGGQAAVRDELEELRAEIGSFR